MNIQFISSMIVRMNLQLVRVLIAVIIILGFQSFSTSAALIQNNSDSTLYISCGGNYSAWGFAEQFYNPYGACTTYCCPAGSGSIAPGATGSIDYQAPVGPPSGGCYGGSDTITLLTPCDNFTMGTGNFIEMNEDSCWQVYQPTNEPPPCPPGQCCNSGGGGGGGSCGCFFGSVGMPVWSVTEPHISLWLRDEPLGYQPSIGPRISFDLAFRHHEPGIGYNTNIFSCGKKWAFSWLSYVFQDQNGSNVLVFPNGGQRTYYTTNDYATNTRLTGNTNTGFTLFNPDGSQYIYGFVVTNSSGAFQAAYLTQQLNAQGQGIVYNYVPCVPSTSPVVRLLTVVDSDGLTNWVYYNAATNSFSTNLITAVTDPFGRTAYLSYNTNGDLTGITDVVSNSSSMTYDTNDWVSSLTTPYGTTGFNITEANPYPYERSVLITHPDGGHELYLFQDIAPGVESSYPSNQIPNTAPFANTFDTNDLNLRDTFYWGPRQYNDLSTTNISLFTTNDFRKAQMKHWMLADVSTVGETISMERDPSPDAAGTTEGQITWYDYAGKTNTEIQGTQSSPLIVAKVLPDGSTRFDYTMRNSFGAVTNDISTYSEGSSVLLRTNVYIYSLNGIDLLITTNALGIQTSSNSYNGYHEVTTNYDALGEMTTYTYDVSNRLTSTTRPSGWVTTNFYGANGLLATQIDIGFATNTYTYTNDLVLTHIDARGLATTNTWDYLNRLTSTIYPDGSYVSNVYTFLDITGTKDRMGNWTYYGYDSMRRKISETNANNAVTRYDYCTCGSLDSVIDAETNVTSFYYDNQGNLTNTAYPDGYSISSTYNVLRQVVIKSDSSGMNITNLYNNQGLLTVSSSNFGRISSKSYDAADRVANSSDANGVSISMVYDNLNRILNRTYPDSGVEKWGYTLNFSGPTSYTNQIGNTTLYAYDSMNRKTNEAVIGVTTNNFSYNGAGDLLTLIDGKNDKTVWNYDSYGRVTNKVDAASITNFIYQYDTDNRITNRWTPAKGSTVYRYDVVGNLINVAYPISPSISLSYDALNRLTNMVDAVGTTVYTYDPAGQLLTEGGLWSSDTIVYAYQSRLRTELYLSHPTGSAWIQNYGYDSARRLTNVLSAAGSFGYIYDPTKLQRVDELTLPSQPNGAYITNIYDSVARLLSTSLINSGGTNVDSEAYGYNVAGQRIVETNMAGDYRNYAYDNEGELVSAIGKEASGVTNRLQEQIGYAYDAAGNLNYRTNNALLQSFQVNNLNELTTETNGGTLTVAGTTTTPATNVTVNGQTANRYADATFALGGFTLTNGLNSYTAIAQDSSGNHSTNTVTVNLPATNNFTYDLNGNLLSDGTRNFAYSDENQLINVWVASAWSNSFVYDGKMRRRIERDYSWNGSAWTETNEVHYIYDGNVVEEERDTNNDPLISYTRGNDLSGSLQGAGGIGGLLARTDYGQEITGSPVSVFYHSDGNGNVMELIYPGQQLAAKYLYDPFGNLLSMSGPLAEFNKYRFSSKEWNDNEGLYYYLYRFYDPNLQRWVNRDPIQERAGINLYELVANNPISWYDWLGLAGGAGKPNGSPCCLEDEPNWQVEGYSSESACVHAWVAPYERRTIVPRAFSRLWYLYMSYQVGFGGGLYAQAFIDCDAGICVKWGHKNGCHCDP